MTQEAVAGTPVGGLRTVGQILPTNDLRFHLGQNGLAIAVELLSTHIPGAPVVDDRGGFAGFISEFDVLRALEAGKDLGKVTAEEIMAKDRIAIDDNTSVAEATRIMEEKRLLNLPVEREGKVAYTITRHDLLRAWIGLGFGMGLEA